MSGELRITEFEALRKELESTSKRTYDTVFFAITASSMILGYSLSKTNIWITLVPLMILYEAYQIVRQSIRSQRRIVAYLKVFHESVDRGALWETALGKCRAIGNIAGSNKRENPTHRLRMAAQFEQLWIFGAASIIAGWLIAMQTTITSMIIMAISTLMWFYVYRQMKISNKQLEGGGLVEEEFTKRFNEIKLRLNKESNLS